MCLSATEEGESKMEGSQIRNMYSSIPTRSLLEPYTHHSRGIVFMTNERLEKDHAY